uniref:Uncharacterized protein n=1 Tax=Brassica oleracea TaxID=3712 RepID=A0A3P6F208_BRAOL|nr:unnamed protein product [Brassica oleracea]
MPRLGPRPYECVKRAWHIDRHQPIRGFIIRQIFRLSMEAHSAATKKNKEWQEKLSVVVFKADEIMYSKSNSEVLILTLVLCVFVYHNLADFGGLTLTTETGPLLPPCVEAALNLGCTAVRASISQRHSNVQTYLCPKFQQPVSASTNEPQYHHQAQKSNKPSPTAQPAIPVDVLDDSNNRGAAFLHESMQVHQKPLARTLGASTAPAPSQRQSTWVWCIRCITEAIIRLSKWTCLQDFPLNAPINMLLVLRLRKKEQRGYVICL